MTVDAAEGEHISRTWSNRHKVNKPRDTIKNLMDPESGDNTSNLQEMSRIAATYHKNIQYNDHNPKSETNREDVHAILSVINRKLSERSKRTLVEQISEEDVQETIRATNNEKAPGLDGILIELWKSMDDQFLTVGKDEEADEKCDIVWVLTQVYTNIENNGMDRTVRLNEGCISPIYKKKNPNNIANYQPITLLNTDYKIFTKALSIKLANVAHKIIDPDQARFIENRSIFDQVKTTKLVIDYMKQTNKKGAIVALDQEKTYDKILHNYLWMVMENFRFPTHFINIIKSLYNNAATTVLINGELSTPFNVKHRVRQGDALSCLLFNIAIEPLAENIRKSTNLASIQIPTRREYLKIKLFADNTTVFLSHSNLINNLQEILNK